MPFNVGPGELIIVLVVILIIFGPGRLPSIGSAIGRGLAEFRKASSDLEDSVRGDAKGSLQPDDISVSPGRDSASADKKT